MQLSALDQSPVFADETPSEALQNTLRCAEACDRLGLHRYWVAEHHGSRSFAGCSPEVLLPLLLERTAKIRIGSGGIMLNHYSPYKVAECFRLMESLFPGRVDLGIGRAPGSDPMQAGALAYGSKTTTAELYPTKVSDLIAWVRNKKPGAEAFRRVGITQNDSSFPAIWQLASSLDGAMYAAHFDLPLALAHFITPDCLKLGKQYRQALTQKRAKEGKVMLAIFAICADSEEEAMRLAAPAALWRKRVGSGRFGRFAHNSEAQALLAKGEAAAGQNSAMTRQGLAGTPAQLQLRLRQIVGDGGVDELMVVTICEPVQARIRSYELLREVVAGL